MDALGQVDIINETADPIPRIFQVLIVVKCGFFLSDSFDQTLGIAVLFGVPDFGPADLTPDCR